jgi:hypothetical protein
MKILDRLPITEERTSLRFGGRYVEAGDHAKADEMLARAAADPSTGPAPTFWDAEAIRLLGREAQRLILDRRFPADPLAH